VIILEDVFVVKVDGNWDEEGRVCLSIALDASSDFSNNVNCNLKIKVII